MKASTKRALSILFSIFFLIATVIVFTNLVLPELNNVKKIQGEVTSKANAYQNQKNAVTQVSKLIGQFQNAKDLQRTLSLAMPIGPSITDALSQWHAISQNSQASVQSLAIKVDNLYKTSNQPLAKGMGVITVDLGTVGTYGAVKQFLGSLETNARVINVSSFDFAPMGGGTSPSALYSMRLTVDTYYQEN